MRLSKSLLPAALATCLTGCAATPEKPVASEITVLSYNIRLGGMRMDRVYDRPLQISIAKAQKADLVAMQEVDRKTSRVKGADVPAEFATALSMNFHYAPAIRLGGGEYGVAVLSKLPVTGTGSAPLPAPGENRAAGWVTVKLPGGGELMFVSTHFDHISDASRLTNTRDLLAAIERSKTTLPVIIAGDLNAEPDSPVFKLFTEAGFRRCEAKKGANLSYPADKPNILIDYVLLRDGATLRLEDAGTEVLNEPLSSDHRPLLSHLRVVPKKP